MLSNKSKCFLLKFYSISCLFETHIEVKELKIEYKNGDCRNIGFKMKNDRYSPWIFSPLTNKDNVYKVFNGLYTDNFEPNCDICKLRIKCNFRTLMLNGDIAVGDDKSALLTELTVDCVDLNGSAEVAVELSTVFHQSPIKLECLILPILPTSFNGNINTSLIRKFSLDKARKPYFVGHRGLGRDTAKPILENTINSFNRCAEYGLDFIELDVHFTKDNQAIVYHDFFVEKSIESSLVDRGKIIDLTYEEIHLKMGMQMYFGLFPTLDQVLKEVSPNIGILVEMKFPQLTTSGLMEHQSSADLRSPTNNYMQKNAYVDKVLNIIIENLTIRSRNIVLLSFDADITLMLKLKQDLFPILTITRGLLLDDTSQNYADNRINTFDGAMMWAKFCGLDGITSRFYESLKENYLLCKRQDLQTFVYGDIPRNREFFVESKHLGLDGLILDDVENIFHQRFLM